MYTFSHLPDLLYHIVTLDSSDPCSAIGLRELNMLVDHFGLQSNLMLSLIPESLRGKDKMQCRNWK